VEERLYDTQEVESSILSEATLFKLNSQHNEKKYNWIYVDVSDTDVVELVDTAGPSPKKELIYDGPKPAVKTQGCLKSYVRVRVPSSVEDRSLK
jgi:hypothetical protein